VCGEPYNLQQTPLWFPFYVIEATGSSSGIINTPLTQQALHDNSILRRKADMSNKFIHENYDVIIN
jgi:hypothetical protein